MSRLEKIALTGLFVLGVGAGAARSQTVSGTVVNYNENIPVSGIELYLDGAIKDTTNAQGTFGFPVSVVRDDSPVIPKDFTLRLFPNPFNPAAIIEYTVPYQGDISIVGYNTLGQRVYAEDLKNQMTGTYKLQFDASKYDLASQILFFQVLLDPKDASKPPLVKIIKGAYVK
ncbi:hypothetical protein JXB02_03780 [Candidatus Woesearchaeota archaeon]|nr:hypothetical protein [Candidatus Woesearchaeota archaeon]